MPLGIFERQVLHLLASNRNPESFVAGATVLHRKQTSPRRSLDIALFHDTAESIVDAVTRDTATLTNTVIQSKFAIRSRPFSAPLYVRETSKPKLNGYSTLRFVSSQSSAIRNWATASISGMPPQTRFWLWLDATNFAITWMSSGYTSNTCTWERWFGQPAARILA